MVSRNIVENLRSQHKYKLAQFGRVRATVWHDRCLQCLHSHRTCWRAIQCVLAMMCCAIPPRTRNICARVCLLCVSIDYRRTPSIIQPCHGESESSFGKGIFFHVINPF